jgi:hypothetical protein
MQTTVCSSPCALLRNCHSVMVALAEDFGLAATSVLVLWRCQRGQTMNMPIGDVAVLVKTAHPTIDGVETATVCVDSTTDPNDCFASLGTEAHIFILSLYLPHCVEYSTKRSHHCPLAMISRTSPYHISIVFYRRAFRWGSGTETAETSISD